MHGSSSRQDGHASLWRPEAEAHVRLSVAIDPSARRPLACLTQGAQKFAPCRVQSLLPGCTCDKCPEGRRILKVEIPS
jgi:hypothetical protein